MNKVIPDQQKYGLTVETLQKIQTVLSHYPNIETVILYGSRAMGNYRNGSDIDLTFQGKCLDADVLYRVDDELDDLLLPYHFDLSLYQEIDNSSLLAHIERVGLRFYEKHQ
jgi:predicted nucleotidyltransferase